ncbi:MAG: DNA-3-methyladenine glycosylase I [Chloroflexi bacterium]|nr:MAG: DNA-3-methyladenine glycosylase I [Chloroflexota bacterium]
MSKAVFQSGMSWKVVEAKWPELRIAMRNFDADAVAGLTPDDIDALTQDTRVIRNRRKLEAIVGNARQLIALDEQHRSFKKYLRSHADFPATVDALRADFKFLGDMGCYYFLYVVGEAVPPHDEFDAHRTKPKARKAAKAPKR